MKRVGLIGGMSWESSAHYYRLLNEGVRDALGPLYSAPSVMVTVNFHAIEQMQRAGEWAQAGKVLAEAALALERAGVDLILLCTNTMHKVAPVIEGAVKVPLLHIADPTANAIVAQGITRVGLLGTAFTMEQDFYKSRLERRGLMVLTPGEVGRKDIHRIIFEELCAGIVRDDSRAIYRKIMHDMASAGVEGIILGCTEIMMLVDETDSPIPLFDTTRLHVQAAVDFVVKSEA
jgi:aspartate racemase